MHLVIVGGSDAGISAALRARELDPSADVTVVVADAYPNFSICGIPYYVSGEVTHWRDLAHRTAADLEAAGLRLRLDTTARQIDVPGRTLAVSTPAGTDEMISYDKLIIGTGAVPATPPIGGLAELDPADGVHLLHSMGDTFALMRTIEATAAASAIIIGAGYIGLEMADALTTRGLTVTQMEQLPEVLPAVDPGLGSAATGSSPAASAPRSSRSSTRPSRAPGCGTTRPPPPDSPRSPSPPKPMTTRPTTPAATASRCASPATAPPADCSACSCSGTGTPRSPSGSTSPPPPSTTA
jgi:Pyridine nucleotide-disulphide oxidoreductase